MISQGCPLADGTGKSVILPWGMIRPILPLAKSMQSSGLSGFSMHVPSSANHTAPSGPSVMPRRNWLASGTGNSWVAPEAVILAIDAVLSSVNYTARRDRG